MVDCIFCRIVRGEIPCQTVWESESVLAFKDIQPKAPVHVLIVPRSHVVSLNDLPSGSPLAGALLEAAAAVARQCGVDVSGYRLIANTNRDGGQEVFHLHFHLLGGRPMGPMVTHG